jgi:hypothetical protein
LRNLGFRKPGVEACSPVEPVQPKVKESKRLGSQRGKPPETAYSIDVPWAAMLRGNSRCCVVVRAGIGHDPNSGKMRLMGCARRLYSGILKGFFRRAVVEIYQHQKTGLGRQKRGVPRLHGNMLPGNSFPQICVVSVSMMRNCQ